MLGVQCGWDGIDVDCGASLVSPACWCAKLVNIVRIEIAKIVDGYRK